MDERKMQAFVTRPFVESSAAGRQGWFNNYESGFKTRFAVDQNLQERGMQAALKLHMNGKTRDLEETYFELANLQNEHKDQPEELKAEVEKVVVRLEKQASQLPDKQDW